MMFPLNRFIKSLQSGDSERNDYILWGYVRVRCGVIDIGMRTGRDEFEFHSS